jgi:hypothetical protein
VDQTSTQNQVEKTKQGNESSSNVKGASSQRILNSKDMNQQAANANGSSFKNLTANTDIQHALA